MKHQIVLQLALILVVSSIANASTIDSSLFAPRVEFPAEPDNTLRPDIALGDLDGDGKLDLALINTVHNILSVFQNTGTGTGIDTGSFAPKLDLTTGDAPSSVAIADLDGDGKLDLAAGNAATATISLFRNTTTGSTLSFAPKVDINSDGSGGNRLAAADLDGDGKPELIFAGFFMAVHRNLSTPGSLSFGPRISIDMGPNNWGLAVRDLDADGKFDLVTVNRSTAILSLQRNTSSPGNITFDSRVDFTVAPTPESIAVGDLNGDGRPDVVVGHLPDVGFGPVNLSLLQNNSVSGGFTSTTLGPPVELAVGVFSIVALADLNGDGKLDLIGSNDHQPGSGDRLLSVLQNVIPPGDPITSAAFASKVSFAAAPASPNPGSNNGALSVAAGDLDGDGRLDLATGHTLGNHVSVFWQPDAGDMEAPIINCSTNIVRGTDAGQCSTTLSYIVTATDNSGTATVSCAPPSGSGFAKGITTVQCEATDSSGNTSSCSFTVTINDNEAPIIACPIDSFLACHVNPSTPLVFAPAASDNCDPAPTVTCVPASGSIFLAGTTVVTCTAQDLSGNIASCSFSVTVAPLDFIGFQRPIEGADATGGSFNQPLRAFKKKSRVPVKFSAACDGDPVLTGIHRLQTTRYMDPMTSEPPLDAVPRGDTSTGNQFRLKEDEWHFNLDPLATGMNIGIWKLTATLSDGSQHIVWIQIK